MKRLHTYLLIIALNISSIPLYAYTQDSTSLFFHYIPRTESSYGTVSGFAQDNEGYIWAVVGDDIMRYDGYKFRTYSSKIASTGEWLISYYNIIYTTTRRLYVTSSSGLFVYNPDTDNFRKIYNHPYRYIWEDCNGKLWLSNNQPVCFDPETGETVPLTTNGKEYAGQFYTSPDTCCAFLFTNDSIYSVNLLTGQCTAEHHDFIRTHIANILVSNGTLYILTTNNGIYRHTSDGFKLTTMLSDDGSIVRARRITGDKHGNLFIATMQGLFQYNTTTSQLKHYKQTNQPGSLDNNSVQAVFIDNDGNLWVGTYASGLLYASTGNTDSRLTIRQSNYNYLSQPISTILPIENKIWYGTEGDGLFCYEHGKGITAHYHSNSVPALPSNNIKALYKNGNNLWIATYLGGLNRLNLKTQKVTSWMTGKTDTHSISDQICDFVADRNGNLWIIFQDLQNVLVCFNTNTLNQQIFHIPAPTGEHISPRLMHIVEGRECLYLSTSTSVHCFSTTDKQILYSITPQTHAYIYDICYDSVRHSLWLSTKSHGIIQYDINTLTFCQPILKDELRQTHIGNLVVEGNYLWLCGNNVLYRYDINSAHLSDQSGYSTNGGNIFSACIQNGNIYIGAAGILTCINTHQCGYNNSPPRTRISDININNVSIFDNLSPDSTLIKGIHNNQLILEHNQNNIAVTLSSTNYYLSNKNKFRFRLITPQKKDPAWNDADADHRTITLMQMPKGKYIFEAKSANNDGVWGDIIRLHITIKPVFWQSATAWIIYILLFIALISIVSLVAHRQYLYRRELQKARLRQQEEEKANRAKVLFFTNVNKELKAPLLTLQTLVAPEHVPYIQQMLHTMDQYTNKYCIDTGSNHIVRHREQQLTELTRLIEERMPQGRIDIDRLAADMGMSRRKFFNFVKEMTGKAPIEYIRSFRLQTAAKLMVEQGLSIKEAMAKVGIEGQSYFIKVFKQEFGDTPTAFVNNTIERMTK
ncbi:MAG: helix-turn-helix domain-containing protein [Paludibacteraceae bacterium]|nr:helix-turn-helix domain-containing protein [Paludibacteraceae bacterium]